MFPDDLLVVYDTIIGAHDLYGRDITPEELKHLVKINHPSITKAAYDLISEVITEVANQPDDIGSDVAEDLFRHMWRMETGRRISEYGINLIDGKHADLHGLISIIEGTREDFLPTQEVAPTTTDVDEILLALDQRAVWRFNIPTLAHYIPGISGGELATVFARPEVGKTGFWVSLTFGPGGFLEQGAKVAVIINEEPAIRTMARGLVCATGMTLDEIRADPYKAKDVFDPIRSNIHMLDDVDMTIERLDLYCKEHKPDIVIVDQMDKCRVSGSFARADQFLREVYTRGREVAKRHNNSLFAICQASAEAEGKTVLHYSQMEESKTGKAAENDLVLGIGKYPHDDTNEGNNRLRFITASKNKLTGWSGTVNCALDQRLHRYVA